MATGEPQVFDFTEDDDDESERPVKPFTVKYRRREYETAQGEFEDDGETPKRVPTGRWVPTEEKFEAKGQIPAGLSLNTIAAFGQSGAAASGAIIQFLHRCLIDGDNTRFLTLIEDDDTRFQMRNLSKIVDWLLTEYGERPTKSA